MSEISRLGDVQVLESIQDLLWSDCTLDDVRGLLPRP
jgi:hypothetical protein